MWLLMKQIHARFIRAQGEFLKVFDYNFSLSIRIIGNQKLTGVKGNRFWKAKSGSLLEEIQNDQEGFLFPVAKIGINLSVVRRSKGIVPLLLLRS